MSSSCSSESEDSYDDDAQSHRQARVDAHRNAVKKRNERQTQQPSPDPRQVRREVREAHKRQIQQKEEEDAMKEQQDDAAEGARHANEAGLQEDQGPQDHDDNLAEQANLNGQVVVQPGAAVLQENEIVQVSQTRQEEPTEDAPREQQNGDAEQVGEAQNHSSQGGHQEQPDRQVKESIEVEAEARVSQEQDVEMIQAKVDNQEHQEHQPKVIGTQTIKTITTETAAQTTPDDLQVANVPTAAQIRRITDLFNAPVKPFNKVTAQKKIEDMQNRLLATQYEAQMTNLKRRILEAEVGQMPDKAALHELALQWASSEPEIKRHNGEQQ